MSPSATPPGTCPHCGQDVPPRALACPGCGADAEAGWSDEPDWAGGLPDGYENDDEFDDARYQEFLRSEGLAEDGRPSAEERRRRRTAVWALLLVIGCLWWLSRR